MKTNPQVSVVLPTFNRARELRRSIHSVLSQTFRDFELIVIDDASTDDTEEVMKGIDDGRLRYERLSTNLGGAEARNIGSSMARGDIVAFQDSDDEWTCLKLEKSVRELEADPAVGWVFSPFIQLWGTGCRRMPMKNPTVDQAGFYESLLDANVVGTPTLVVKRAVLETVGGFDASMPRYQDWELALRLAQVSQARFINEPLILSYVTAGSITQNKEAHRVGLRHIYEKHIDAITRNRSLKATWSHRLGDAMLSTGKAEGRRLLLAALLCEPLNIRYFVKATFSMFGSASLYNMMTGAFRKGR